MVAKPKIAPGQWIAIGGARRTRAVICTVYEDTPNADCAVVYLDRKNEAITEDVKWDAAHWEFVFLEPGGNYAESNRRLQNHVAILRQGEHPF